MTQDPVRVFIGSGEASLLERKTLIYSLRKNSRRPVEVYVLNGTHNAVEPDAGPPFAAPMSLRVKYRNYTEFSLYRFLIPQLCNHRGRGIYLDSDMVCLGDIGELFDLPMDGCDFLSVRAYDTNRWGPSVMLIDCDRCRFDLEQICDETDAGLYSYTEFTQFDDRYLARHPQKIGVLDPNWNVFDRCDEQTKLIHYTNLLSQPWKFPGHPHGELWFQYFREAQAAGQITDADIAKSIGRGYVRPTIQQGNQQPPPPVAAVAPAPVRSPPPAIENPAPLRRPNWLKRLSRKLRGKPAA